MDEQQKKTYLIVGASGGIGAAVAEEISDEKTHTILVGRREERLNEVSKKCNGDVTYLTCDVRDYESISAVFVHIKNTEQKLSGMIYCSGIWCMKPLKIMEAGEVEDIFRTNVFGFYEMCRLFCSPKVSEKGASVVGISSISSLTEEPGISAYSMSKAAMNAMVRSLSTELIKRDIRINAVLPGIVDSKMGQDTDDRTEEDFERIRSSQPLGVIPAKDVAEMVRYLLSPASRHMTGELITISGGYRG